MIFNLNNSSDDSNNKHNPFKYEVGQFQTNSNTTKSSSKKYKLLVKEDIPAGTYRSEIISVNSSEKFSNAFVIIYRIKRKLDNECYDTVYTDVAFTYFKNNLHLKKLDNTLTAYGLKNTKGPDLVGLVEEVSVKYIPNDRYGYFDPRRLISYPQNFQGITPSSSPQSPLPPTPVSSVMTASDTSEDDLPF